jgi:hypothetical protein
VAVYTACIYSGNRRTPRRDGLTAGIGGLDTCNGYKITVDHEVRLLSVKFNMFRVYHAGVKPVKEIEVQSSP